MPELGEPRIEIEIGLLANPALQRVEPEVAGDVQQQVRRLGHVQQLAVREAAGPRSVVADEGRRVRQTFLAHHVLEVGYVRALREGHRLTAIVRAVLRGNLLDVIDLQAQLSEAVHPVQDGARVAAVSALGGDHAGHEDGAHLATALAPGWRTS